MPTPVSRITSLRARVEAQFEKSASFVAGHPWSVIAACALFVAACLPSIPTIVFNTSIEESLFPDHPVRVAYDEFKEQFGSEGFIVVTLEGENVFDRAFLEQLRTLHEALEENVPYLDEVTSLVNVRSTRGEADELIVEDLLEAWPESPADLAVLEARVRSTPFYQRTFVGDEGRLTSLVIELVNHVDGELDPLAFEPDPGGHEEQAGETLSAIHEIEAVAAIEEVLAGWHGGRAQTHLAGLAVTNKRIVQDIGENFIVFLAFSFIAMVFVLALLFRRVAGVVLPLLVVMATQLGIFGFIGWRGSAVNMTAQILPSFLMAVAASASIHVLVLFFQRFDAGDERVNALRRALGHSGPPISMACITTALGLGSFLVADLAPIQDLGVLAPIGIVLAWTFTVFLLPAMLCVIPMRRRALAVPPALDARGGPRLSRVGRAVVAVGDFSVAHPRSVVAATAALIVAGIAGASQLEFEFDALTWFPEDDPIHRDTEISDRRMGGSIVIEALVDSGRENGLHDPDLQRRIEGFEAEALGVGRGREVVRKTASVNGVVKEIHQALNENRPEFYATPGDRKLIAQELLLFEGSGADDLEELVDSQFRLARVSLRTVWGSATDFAPIMAELRGLTRRWFPDEEVSLSGSVAIIMAAQVEMQLGMFRSYGVALLTITPIMMLMIGSLRGGLVSMVPNLLPILVVLGVMGATGIRIDFFTMLTGSVAIGLAVDDTIHFLHNFYREFDVTGDAREAVRRTLETTGQALLTTSVVLSIGFGVFMLASMPTLQLFGMITVMAILLAFTADIVVAPALVTLVTRHRQRRAA